VTIGTLTAQSEEAWTTRIKKSGISIGGGGLFIGSAKGRNSSTQETSTNTGSLVGSEAWAAKAPHLPQIAVLPVTASQE